MTAHGQDPAQRRPNSHRLAIWGGAAALLLAPPLVLELFDETRGDPGDFVFAAILWLTLGLAYELAARTPPRRAYVAAWTIAGVTGLISLWLNLAVGIIGSEDNPANLIYAAVLAVAALGGLLARFRPSGMARAMVATALAQVAVFVFALAAGLGFTGPITVFFVGLWLLSAWLFQKAAR